MSGVGWRAQRVVWVRHDAPVGNFGCAAQATRWRQWVRYRDATIAAIDLGGGILSPDDRAEVLAVALRTLKGLSLAGHWPAAACR